MRYPINYIAWDLETSGLDPRKDKILEIGAMKISGDQIVEERSWVLNHGIEIPTVITEITGITKEITDCGVDPAVAMEEFLSMFTDSWTANLTHNGYKFDLPFLFAAMNDMQVQVYKDKIARGCIDSAVLFKARGMNLERMWNESFLDFAKRVMETRIFGLKYNIAHCCNELGIETAGANFHRALGDVSLTNQIYKKLVEK